VRLRLYAGTGLGTLQITTLNTFCTVTVWLGFFALAGGALVVEPSPCRRACTPRSSARRSAWFSCSLCSPISRRSSSAVAAHRARHHGLAALAATRAHPDPNRRTRLGLCALALYLLLPAPTPFSFARFLAVFLLAQVAGLASQVPGGLGVFEAVMLLNLSSSMPATKILGSLIAFRIVYYLLPLAVAALMLAVFELWQRREALSARAVSSARSSPTRPAFLAVTTFAAA